LKILLELCCVRHHELDAGAVGFSWRYAERDSFWSWSRWALVLFLFLC